VACLVVAGGYAGLASWRLKAAAGRAPAVTGEAADVLRARHQQPVALFRSLARESFDRLAVAPVAAPEAASGAAVEEADARRVTALRCERVHFAADRGVCLTTEPADPVQSTYRGLIFDEAFQVTKTFQLTGIPSRVRVAPDGRLAAATVFETGHDYRQDGGFSTRTILLDTATGFQVADLEDFAVFDHGARFLRDDFNFWGVTFARDGNRFYATLASGMKTYLLLGDVAAREAHILRENAECPSLSPDNTRLVFKKRVEVPGGGGEWQWRLHLLDLATLTETPLAETRNIDDQVDWLDEATSCTGSSSRSACRKWPPTSGCSRSTASTAAPCPASCCRGPSARASPGQADHFGFWLEATGQAGMRPRARSAARRTSSTSSAWNW
jgi:hypothetical protein